MCLQSQEVTYAELGTLPRRTNGCGYAQLRPSPSGIMISDETAVVYARINHGANGGGHMVAINNEVFVMFRVSFSCAYKAPVCVHIF